MARPLHTRVPAPPGSVADPLTHAPLGGTRSEALRRLQMGALGVVAVLLLIGLASMIKDRATQTASTAVAGAVPTTAPSETATAADPLAEAGVVPEIPASPAPDGARAAPQAVPADAR